MRLARKCFGVLLCACLVVCTARADEPTELELEKQDDAYGAASGCGQAFGSMLYDRYECKGEQPDSGRKYDAQQARAEAVAAGATAADLSTGDDSMGWGDDAYADGEISRALGRPYMIDGDADLKSGDDVWDDGFYAAAAFYWYCPESITAHGIGSAHFALAEGEYEEAAGHYLDAQIDFEGVLADLEGGY